VSSPTAGSGHQNYDGRFLAANVKRSTSVVGQQETPTPETYRSASDWLQPDDKGIANGRSTQIAAAQPRPARVTLECPERSVGILLTERRLHTPKLTYIYCLPTPASLLQKPSVTNRSHSGNHRRPIL